MMWKSFVLASSHHTPNKVSALVTTPASKTSMAPRCAPDCAFASVIAMLGLSPFPASRSTLCRDPSHARGRHLRGSARGGKEHVLRAKVRADARPSEQG